MLLTTIEDVVLACIALHNFRRKTGFCFNDNVLSNTRNPIFEEEEFIQNNDAQSIRDYLKDLLQRN